MRKLTLKTSVAAGIVLAAGLSAGCATDNPFGMGDGNAAQTRSASEGKCGGKAEGKCGAGKSAKEGKCGGSSEGKCGANKKKKEGKCGGSSEGKCGAK